MFNNSDMDGIDYREDRYLFVVFNAICGFHNHNNVADEIFVFCFMEADRGILVTVG